MIAAVTRAEGNLLTLARVAVGVVPPIDAMRLLVTPVTPPPKLGPTARGLLEDTLARGTVLSLARGGGWLDRAWDRATPPLQFTANTVRLLSWMLSTPLAEGDVAPLVLAEPPTPAEDALLTMLLDRLRGTGCDAALARQLELRRWPLTVLTHAAFLAREVAMDDAPTLDVKVLSPWLATLRVVLARAWLSAERTKRDVVQVDAVARMGRAQSVVLSAFLDAIDAANQRRHATFLVDAAVTFLQKQRTADELTRSMSTDAPLRDRSDARRAALATWRALGRLQAWDAEHRVVRFMDDGYDEAQALVRDWARLGDRGFSAAAELVRAGEALG